MIPSPIGSGERLNTTREAIVARLSPQASPSDLSPLAPSIKTRAYAWTEKLADLSGLEVDGNDWVDITEPPSTLIDLLTELGRVYAPFMLANAAAVEQGADTVDCEIDGRRWVQQPFVYQAKCLCRAR